MSSKASYPKPSTATQSVRSHVNKPSRRLPVSSNCLSTSFYKECACLQLLRQTSMLQINILAITVKPLCSYKHRVGRSDLPTCPHCLNADENTSHLFNCAANPTDLVIGNLWRHSSLGTPLSIFLLSFLLFGLRRLQHGRNNNKPIAPLPPRWFGA